MTLAEALLLARRTLDLRSATGTDGKTWYHAHGRLVREGAIDRTGHMVTLPDQTHWYVRIGSLRWVRAPSGIYVCLDSDHLSDYSIVQCCDWVPGLIDPPGKPAPESA